MTGRLERDSRAGRLGVVGQLGVVGRLRVVGRLGREGAGPMGRPEGRHHPGVPGELGRRRRRRGGGEQLTQSGGGAGGPRELVLVRMASGSASAGVAHHLVSADT
jgi:hypothetical protein